MRQNKGFVLVEAILVFAGCVLIVVMILASIDHTKHLQNEIHKIDESVLDEKLKNAY